MYTGYFPPLLDCTEILLGNDECLEYNKTITVIPTKSKKDLDLLWDEYRNMESVTDNSLIRISAEELQSLPKPVVLQVSVMELSENIQLQSREHEHNSLVFITESYIPKLPGIILLAAFSPVTQNALTSIFRPVRLNTTIHFDLRNDKSLLSYGDKNVMEITRQCVSLDPSSGNWTSKYCESISNNLNEVICQCRESVAFTVRYQIIYDYRTSLLFILIKIAAVLYLISLVFLLITLFVLIKFAHKIKRDLATVQISVTLSIFLLYVFTVLINNPFEFGNVESTLCIIKAVIDNYLAIAAQFNALIQGILMYIKICLAGKLESGNDLRRRHLILLLCFAWLTPALIVLVTTTVGFSNRTYMMETKIYNVIERKFGQVPSSIYRYKVCWASIQFPTALSVGIPLVIVFTVNSCIIIRIARVIWRKSVPSNSIRPRGPSDQRRASDILIRFRTTSRAIAILTLSLGSPFIITVILALTSELHLALVIHGILFGSQGVGIFFLYCILNSSIRCELKAMCVWNRNKCRNSNQV